MRENEKEASSPHHSRPNLGTGTCLEEDKCEETPGLLTTHVKQKSGFIHMENHNP